MRTLVWFRGKDLRVEDHAPLADAALTGEVVPLFVLDPYFFAPARARAIGPRIQLLLESLEALARALERLGSRLLVAPGKSVEVVPRVARAVRADRVVAQAWTEPFGRERDARVRAALASTAPLELFDGELLAPHGAVRTGAGGAFAVFTPFARAFRAKVKIVDPTPAPPALPALPPEAARVEVGPIPTLEELGVPRNPRLLSGGEPAARARLEAFVRERLRGYADARDRLDLAGTSRLSQDLKLGLLSPRTVWRAVERAGPSADATKLHDELLWRDFAFHVLDARPDVLERPYRRDFEGFPWREDAPSWEAWCEGRTGYPVVDAAARQLLAEGFVHNRARMIAASFLTKHLLVSYTRGEAHYLRHLADGDWAPNNLGWQWSAGCGCDAQPYFRVFNPTAQGQRFDPEGRYVKRWLPELAGLDARYVHAPWEAPPLVARAAGLGRAYPAPVVEHAAARARFLATAKAHLARGREG